VKAKPNVITGISEIYDLPAAVTQHFRKRDDPLLDIKDLRSRVAFAENVLFGSQPPDRGMLEPITLPYGRVSR
jgi:hypothetical protein